MTDSNTDKVKQTIRGLLNLAANNAATEGEVANALRFARRMMDAHHLSEDECRRDPDAQHARAEVMGTEEWQNGNALLWMWEKSLGSFVERFVGSVGAYITGAKPLVIDGRAQFDAKGKRRATRAVVFFGPVEDCALATELYATLRETVATMARLRVGGAHFKEGRAYAEGFVAGLFRQLGEAKRVDEASTESRALVVQSTAIATATKARAVGWLKAQGVRLGSARSGGTGITGSDQRAAYNSGVEDGRKATVSASRRSKVTGEAQRRLN